MVGYVSMAAVRRMQRAQHTGAGAPTASQEKGGKLLQMASNSVGLVKVAPMLLLANSCTKVLLSEL